MERLMSKCFIGKVEFYVPVRLKGLKVHKKNDPAFITVTEGECVFHTRDTEKNWIKPINTTASVLAEVLKSNNDQEHFIVGHVV